MWGMWLFNSAYSSSALCIHGVNTGKGTFHLLHPPLLLGNRDGSVGIATRYGLDGLWFESRRGRDFCRLDQTGPLGPPSLPCRMYRVSFREWSVRDLALSTAPPPCSADIKESVELHLYSPSPSPGLHGQFWGEIRISFWVFYCLCSELYFRTFCDVTHKRGGGEGRGKRWKSV